MRMSRTWSGLGAEWYTQPLGISVHECFSCSSASSHRFEKSGVARQSGAMAKRTAGDQRIVDEASEGLSADLPMTYIGKHHMVEKALVLEMLR